MADTPGAGGPPQGPPPPYIRYLIETRIVDEKGALVDEFEDTQEFWLQPPNIAVRRTRELEDGSKIVYEDRGTVDQSMTISGQDGFGGQWSGNAFPMQGVFHTEGRGAKASFHMTAWTLEPHKEEACLRVIDVDEAVPFLTKEPLAPGRYFVHTRDHIKHIGNDVPDELTRPL